MEKLEEQLFYFTSLLSVDPGVVLPFLVTCVLGIIFVLIDYYIFYKKNLKIQLLAEIIYDKFYNFIISVTGPKNADRLLPILATIFFMILFQNLLGIIPGFKSPTSIFSNCLSMAVIVFFLTHGMGIYYNGLHYIYHLIGEPIWLAPISLPIHIIGELAKPISLTLRLFGNIMGDDVVVLVLTVSLFPLLLPIPMIIMSIFTSFLQALVFTILSGIYMSDALGE